MATKDVKSLQKIQKPMLRQHSTDESVQQLLVLLRKQEENPDEALLKETKCLLSLSLDKTIMPPLPSITTKKAESSGERGNKDKQKIKKQKESLEMSVSSDDEVTDATQSPTFRPSANVKRRLPSLGSREEGCTTTVLSKTSPQSWKT